VGSSFIRKKVTVRKFFSFSKLGSHRTVAHRVCLEHLTRHSIAARVGRAMLSRFKGIRRVWNVFKH